MPGSFTLLLLAAPASALLVQPALRRPAAVIAQPKPTMVLDDLKDAIVPQDTRKSLRNVFGYQCLGWGVGGLLFPLQMTTTLFAITSTPASTAMLRGMSIANIALGAKICSDTDKEAASTGFLFFASWTYFIKKLLAANACGAYSVPIMYFNALCALVAARRMGGLYKTLTEADTALLSSLLWKDQDTSTRNLVGVQLFAWGVIASAFQPFLFGQYMLGVAGGAVMSMTASGLGLANLLLGGRTFRATDKEAAVTGLLIFGGWAVIGWLGKAAGIFTGKYLLATTLWNAIFASYCLYKAM